jgi:hypothetical protein
MITRVSIGQVRFNLPGLTADARGVAAGKELLLRFATLERLVGFLRLLSGERTSEEVWGQMRVLHARPMGGTREVFVRLANPAAEVTDQLAATARLGGGGVFTGSGRHFVPARDARAPLGYDAAAIAEDDGDFTLYLEEGRTTFRQEGDLSLERLLLRLELRRRPGGAQARAARSGLVYVVARRGLALPLIDRLFAAGVDGQAAICEGGRPSPFASKPGFWLLRLPELPARLYGLAARTPGLTLYLPVLEDVLVASDWEHPVRLGSCRAALRGDRMLLLPPPPSAVIEIAPRPTFVALSDLVKIRPAAAEEPRALVVPAGNDPLAVPLRLEAVSEGPPRPRAVLVPWARSGWLRRLLFALPASALRGYRVAFLEPGVLILASERMEGIPFGQLLEELIPGALVPVGTRLRPALSADLLAERLGISEGSLCVFPAIGAASFRVAREAFEPLERRALARNDIPWASSAGSARGLVLGGTGDSPPEIENDPLGVLPLWGFRP